MWLKIVYCFKNVCYYHIPFIACQFWECNHTHSCQQSWDQRDPKCHFVFYQPLLVVNQLRWSYFTIYDSSSKCHLSKSYENEIIIPQRTFTWQYFLTFRKPFTAILQNEYKKNQSPTIHPRHSLWHLVILWIPSWHQIL